MVPHDAIENGCVAADTIHDTSRDPQRVQRIGRRSARAVVVGVEVVVAAEPIRHRGQVDCVRPASHRVAPDAADVSEYPPSMKSPMVLIAGIPDRNAGGQRVARALGRLSPCDAIPPD